MSLLCGRDQTALCVICGMDDPPQTTFSVLHRLPLQDLLKPGLSTNINTCRIWIPSEARKEGKSLAVRSGTIVQDDVTW